MLDKLSAVGSLSSIPDVVPTLTLKRGLSGDHGTPGLLFRGDGTRLCYTLELPWRDNVRQRSCIPPGLSPPPGRYRCVQVWSPHFGRVYNVTNVPGRSAILIHSGNFGGDVTKGLRTHVLGCIIVGLSVGQIDGQFALINSMPARTKLQTEMAGLPFDLEVVPWTS